MSFDPPPSLQLSLVAAMASNRVIGAGGQLPWHLSADLRRFKALTMGKPLLMGRKTYQSIGHPLPGRSNIVLTSRPDFAAPGCMVVHSASEALEKALPAQELFVIGGASLYCAFLGYAERIYLTLIHHQFPGDVYFPEIDPPGWYEAQREDVADDPNFPYPYSFILLRRRQGPQSSGA